MFRRKKNDPLADYGAVRPEDRKVLAALIAHGAKLEEPRHVLHFVFQLDESSARELALSVSGWEARAKPPPDGYTDWSVVFERSDHVLTPENVAADAELFTRLASERGGNYDGWEASV